MVSSIRFSSVDHKCRQILSKHNKNTFTIMMMSNIYTHLSYRSPSALPAPLCPLPRRCRRPSQSPGWSSSSSRTSPTSSSSATASASPPTASSSPPPAPFSSAFSARSTPRRPPPPSRLPRLQGATARRAWYVLLVLGHVTLLKFDVLCTFV